MISGKIGRKIFGIVLILIGIYLIAAYVINPAVFETPIIFINLHPRQEMQELYEKHDWQTLKLYTDFIVKMPVDDKTKQMALKYHKEADDKLNSLSYKGEECVKGILTGQVSDMTSLTCVTLSDLTFVGDVRDLTIQSIHFLTGQKVDKFIVLLSGIGLFTNEIPGVDVGDSVLKTFAKVGAISKRFTDTLIELLKARKIDELKPIFKDTDSLVNEYGKYGLVPLARTYRYVDSGVELANLNKLTKDIGPATTYIIVTKTDGNIIKDGEIINISRISDDVVSVDTKEGRKFIEFISPRFTKINIFKATLKDLIDRKGYAVLTNYIRNTLGIYSIVVGVIFISLGFLYLKHHHEN